MVTDEQLDNFLISESAFDPSEPPVGLSGNGMANISLMPTSDIQRKLQKKAWTSEDVDVAKKSLYKSLGADGVIPPTEFERDQNLQFWWREEGQFVPRHVLDQLGIIGGEKVPTIQDMVRYRPNDKQRVSVVKDFLAIERPIGKDPLDNLTILPTVADPDDFPDPIKELEPKMADIIKASFIDDLRVIKETILNNPLDFDDKLFKTIEDEIKIKEAMPDVIEMMRDKPLTVLLGTDFFNTLAFNLPEYTSRKGFSPTESLLGLPKGTESVWIRSVARIREQLAAEDPSLLTRIGLESGGMAADLIKFALIPDSSKASVFIALTPAAKAAIGVGTKAGLVELLKAPAPEETFEERVNSVALSTGIGALTGYVLNKAITFIKDIPVNQQASRLAKKFPQIKQDEWVDILKAVKENRLIELSLTKPEMRPSRLLSPTGFRPGVAEIEKPAKLIGGAIKQTAKTKEVLAIEAAKTALQLKVQASKVKPIKIITKKEALSFQESNLVTGEGDKIRIIADPKVAKAIQVKEKEIAALKTRRNELLAEKQFAVAKTQAQEIAKKEIALGTLREKAGIKLEQTIEGSKAKIANIREATEFKDSLRNDAISMITAIPKELRPSFINRANKVKTLNGLQKLTDEVEVGIEKFERKIAVGDLRDTIKQLESKNRLGKVRLGKIPSPQREKLISIIDEISLKKISTQLEPPPGDAKTFAELDVKARGGREQLLGADLASLQKVTQRLSSELAGGLESLDVDTETALRLPSERVRRLNLLTQKNIAEIGVDDIKLVTQSLQQLAHNAKLKGQLLTKQGLKPLDGAIKTITEKEIAPTGSAIRKAKKTTVIKKGKLEKTTDFGKRVIKLDDAHLDTLVSLSTNPDSIVMKQILDTDLHEGLRKTSEKIVEWIDASTQQFKKIGFTDIEQLSEEVEVTLGGNKIKVEKDFLVKLELHSRSPDNLRAILTTQGWDIEGSQIDYPEGTDRLAELKKALDIVRKDSVLTGIADWTNKLNPSQAEAINETSLLLNGYETAREELYTSRPRSLPQRVEGGKDISVPPEQQGRYLPRQGGTQRLKLERWSDDFLSGIESDANMYGMSIPLRNARILVSSNEFQSAMKKAGREIELNNMVTILRRVQGVTTSRSTLEVFGSRIQRGITTSALGFRVSTVLAQAGSYPAYFSVIDPIYGRPMVPVRSEYINELAKDSSLMNLRWKGRRIGIEVGTSASFEAFETLFFGKSHHLTNQSLKGMIWGDKQAIGNGHKAAVREILSTPRNGKNVDVFEWNGENVADLPPMTDELSGAQGYPVSKKVRYAAARRLEYASRLTQPAFDMLDRSVSLSNPNPLERSFFIFRTALEAQENILIRSTDAYSKSAKTMADKRNLANGIGSVVVSAFSVAVAKKGLKWAIRTTATTALTALGIFTFDDKRERESLPVEIAKDTAKNIISLSKLGKFAVEITERIADSVSGDGYNWNRNSFNNPVLDVLQTGADAVVAVTQAVVDSGLLDEFVEEATQADKDFNKQLEDRIINDVKKAFKTSYEFGVRITGQPLLAPVQEFLRPVMVDSEIKIIKEVTYGDVESPQKFSERVFSLFEYRKELNTKSKKQRLSNNEDLVLRSLNQFAEKVNSIADIIKETPDPEERSLRFSLIESYIDTIENKIEYLSED